MPNGSDASHARLPAATRAAFVTLTALTLAACTTPYSPPTDTDLPLTLRAGPNQHLDQVLSAHGQTLYECRRDGGARAWTREGDLATLVDPQRRSVGTVAPGGYFTAYDNSYVVTRADAFAQVTAGTLVWARLVARQQPGSVMREGRFARTSMIQQVDTTGGLPPDPLCDREGGTLLVPFSATYLIYSQRLDAPASSSAHTTGRTRATQTPWGGFPHPANGAAPLPND
ncbi:DUF3455 domain-containing protein [Paraburkholderia sp. D15]|uniref:DUF3455 domain-containing protein n=1 Tax=Paraburkholderia sp. D15 TaxID=2880218 RepID=UPI00247980F1|nr:DUF3455 domain-containing protein [Paraburkholderia sp. D15]WGS54174.1 DUF3455 domain-containing protein [Paraburkholderia sp. D15]